MGFNKSKYIPKEGTPTEHEIQVLLYRWAKDRNRRLNVPNVKVFGWESDLINVTRSNLVHEYEIKRTTADFKRDFKKRRHGDLKKHARWRKKVARPSYFWYVSPYGIISKSDLPDHAGLITFTKKLELKVKKKAPRLHSEKISERARKYLERGMDWRMWSPLSKEAGV